MSADPGGLLRDLASPQAQSAWTAFLEAYAGVIYQVVGLFERDAEQAASCFLFVCEHLSDKQYRRLRAFRPGGAASFTTWLRAVVRNLCLDWHRHEFGRQRIFTSIARLPALDQEVYRCVYERGMSHDEIVLALAPRFPEIRSQGLEQICARIEQNLTPRQLWLLRVQRPARRAMSARAGDEGLAVPDSARGPETLAVEHQQQARLARALSGLPDGERLMIRLRFEEELTLQQVAQTLGLPDAQTADRRIREILERLKKQME